MIMKKHIYLSIIFIFAISLSGMSQKKGKKNEVDPNAAYKEELAGYKKDCRAALKPYRYDGAKTTYFTYKSFEYMKEVEIVTLQKSEYRLSFNANGIHHDKIQIKIYDKPKEAAGRVLLYEKSSVGGNVFKFETGDMLEKLKAAKLAKGTDPAVVDLMRIKRLYIDYIIPAVDRETETDNATGKSKLVAPKGAIILAVGYSNL